MRAMYEHEPEMDPVESNDITLGMTALLGVFFVIVLVCAVLFGFGYSEGRHLHLGGSGPALTASAPPPTPAKAADSGGESAAPARTAAPDAAADSATQPTGSPALATATPAAKPMPGSAAPDEDTSADAPAPRHAARVPVHAAALPPASVAAVEPVASGGVMVQIAAVGKQGDAEALTQALRKNGFAAIIRTEPQDKFLHVQVGPFATKDQARAMRARLQADGYNAFMKP